MRGGLRRGWSHPLSRLAAFGLAVRLFLAPFTSWTGDVAFYYWGALDVLAGVNPYHSMYYAYPPGWAWTFAVPMLGLSSFVPPAGFAAFVPSMLPVAGRSLLVVPFVTSPVFNVVLKAPLIVADLATGLLIFRLVGDARGAVAAKSAFALWFLNPLVILVGAVNGQFDVLPSLFLLLGMYFLLRREAAYAGIALSISVFYKLFAIYLLPAYLVLLLSRGPDGRPTSPGRGGPALQLLAGFLAASGLLAVVFPWSDGTAALLRRVSAPSYGGFTPLALLGLANPVGIGAALAVVGIVGPLVLATLLTALLARGHALGSPGAALRELASITVVGLVILFAFTTLVNPQYLLWILPGMILLAYLDGGTRRFVVGMSAIGLVYVAFLAGPFAFFYPASVFAGWPPTPFVNASILAFWDAPGLDGGALSLQVILILSVAGFVLLVLQAGSALREFRRPAHA